MRGELPGQRVRLHRGDRPAGDDDRGHPRPASPRPVRARRGPRSAARSRTSHTQAAAASGARGGHGTGATRPPARRRRARPRARRTRDPRTRGGGSPSAAGEAAPRSRARARGGRPAPPRRPPDRAGSPRAPRCPAAPASAARRRPAFVPGDRREPRGRVPRPAAVQQAAVGGEERLLRRVLRLVLVAQEDTAEPEHRRAVALEELRHAQRGRPVVGAAVARDSAALVVATSAARAAVVVTAAAAVAAVRHRRCRGRVILVRVLGVPGPLLSSPWAASHWSWAAPVRASHWSSSSSSPSHWSCATPRGEVHRTGRRSSSPVVVRRRRRRGGRRCGRRRQRWASAPASTSTVRFGLAVPSRRVRAAFALTGASALCRLACASWRGAAGPSPPMLRRR